MSRPKIGCAGLVVILAVVGVINMWMSSCAERRAADAEVEARRIASVKADSIARVQRGTDSASVVQLLQKTQQVTAEDWFRIDSVIHALRLPIEHPAVHEWVSDAKLAQATQVLAGSPLSPEALKDARKIIGAIIPPLTVAQEGALASLNQQIATASDADAGRVLKYRLISKEDQSYRDSDGQNEVRKMAVKIVLTGSGIPRESDIKATAGQLWSDGNRAWSSYRVWVYLPGMSTKWAAYATVVFSQTGMQSIEITESALYDTKWWPQIAARNRAARQRELSADPRKPVAYQYEAVIGARGHDSVEVSLHTNVPDGTMIMVSAEREYWENRGREAYVGDLFERDIAVSNGMVHVVFPIRDAKWLADYSRKLMDFPDQMHGIRKISPTVIVDVLLSPRRDQPAAVLSVLGKDGQALGGPALEVDDAIGLRSLRVRQRLAMAVRR